MKVLATISRIFVGTLFVVSGLIKLNDPLGFSYKLEEYFENGALAYRVRDLLGWETFSLEMFMEHALLLGVIMCVLEVVLGFSLLFGTMIKQTLFALFGLTILFFFLTLHTATCDPFSNYGELHSFAKGSDDHKAWMLKSEENEHISVASEDDKEITFREELPVQCVTDCGCFGDAMKGSLGRSLTPWESFQKDLVILILLIPIFFYRNKIQLNNTKEDVIILLASIGLLVFFSWVFNWYFILTFGVIGFLGYAVLKLVLKGELLPCYIIIYTMLLSLAIVYISYNYLPLRDYRAYAVGKNIMEQMTLPEGAKQPVYQNTFYYKNKTTNKVEEFDENNYPWDNDNYEFHDRKAVLIEAGDEPAITDFSIVAEDGNDYTTDFLNEPGYVFVLVAYDISKTDVSSFKKINIFVDRCNQEGDYFIGLTSSPYNDVEDFRHKQQTMFDFYTCDATTLKTIVRANPGVVLLKQGEVLAKWSIQDLPDYDDVKQTLN